MRRFPIWWPCCSTSGRRTSSATSSAPSVAVSKSAVRWGRWPCSSGRRSAGRTACATRWAPSTRMAHGSRARRIRRPIATVKEPHDRGAIVVSAVFEALKKIYEARIADLRRIASRGPASSPMATCTPTSSTGWRQEASRAAQRVLEMVIRALDYMPPAETTFGDFLRAIVTADYEMRARRRRQLSAGLRRRVPQLRDRAARSWHALAGLAAVAPAAGVRRGEAAVSDFVNATFRDSTRRGTSRAIARSSGACSKANASS